MAYDADMLEIEYPEISLVEFESPTIPLQCSDNRVTLEISYQDIEFMSSGGKIMFPIVYNFNAYAFDIGTPTIEFETNRSSILPHDIVQCQIGLSAAYRIHAIRPSEGDDSIELVLTDTLFPYSLDFIASPTYGTIPLVVNFVNLSPSIHDIKHFLWDFGDGNISTEESPTHTYTEVGVYTIVLMGIDMYNNRKFVSRKSLYITTVEEERFINKSTKCFVFWVPVELGFIKEDNQNE